MTVSVTPNRLQELFRCCSPLLLVDQVSCHELQSMLGVMSLVTACVRPSRIFMLTAYLMYIPDVMLQAQCVICNLNGTRFTFFVQNSIWFHFQPPLRQYPPMLHFWHAGCPLFIISWLIWMLFVFFTSIMFFPRIHTFNATLTQKRILGTHSRQNHPVMPDILISIVHLLNLTEASHVALWALFTAAFFSFLRQSNLVASSASTFNCDRHLARHDIKFTDSTH